MNVDLVSIIIPSYNHCNYILEAMQSVIDQSYSNIELIIIDDGSTDDSIKKITPFLSEKIQLYTQSNKGAHASINRGIRLSKGKYISILNSDDTYHPNRIEILVNSAKEHPTRALFFTSLKMVDEHSSNYTGWRLQHYTELKQNCQQHINDDYFLIGNIAYTTSNFFFTRETVSSIGNFLNLRYTHDWNFSLRCLLHNKPYWIDEELVSYRVHATNTISESNDVIPHFIENSYNLSWFLHNSSTPKSDWYLLDHSYINLLLMNDSYCPVIHNYFINILEEKTYTDASDFLQFLKDNNTVIKLQKLLAKRDLDPLSLQSPFLTDNLLLYKKELLQLLNDRDQTIVDMGNHINDKGRAIISMETLIDDKDHAIQKQTDMIDGRNRQIELLNKQLERTVDHLIKNSLKRIISFTKNLIP